MKACLLGLVLLASCDDNVVRPTRETSPVDQHATERLADRSASADRLVSETRPLDLSRHDSTKPAGEVVLYDGDNLKFTVADNGFHYVITAGDPLPLANWMSPTNYYDGQMQIRYLIRGPAGQKPGKLQVCFWTMPSWQPESCSPNVLFTGVGTFLNPALVPSAWWKNANVPLDFSHPEKLTAGVVLRGTSDCCVTTFSDPDACWEQWPDFQAMTFRLTMVMVPKGATFSGWQSYP
jgi:hypothetical protein